jgi:hypothetical protein
MICQQCKFCDRLHAIGGVALQAGAGRDEAVLAWYNRTALPGEAANPFNH